MTANPPTFGPTAVIPCDENSEPFAIVRLDLVVSRDQLRTAIAIGHAELAGEPALDEMSVNDIRREVEGHLAAGAAVELYRETARIVGRLTETDRLADVDAAVDRAYTRPEPPQELQAPVYGDGTVTLETPDAGAVTVDEPAWCIGHTSQPNPYRADIAHNSVTVSATATTGSRGRVQLLQANISHAPYLELHTEPHPVVSVQLDCVEDFIAEDIPQLVEGLRSAEKVLTFVAAEAIRLRGETA